MRWAAQWSIAGDMTGYGALVGAASSLRKRSRDIGFWGEEAVVRTIEDRGLLCGASRRGKGCMEL